MNTWIALLLTLWVCLGLWTCILVARGAITERELAKIAEAERNIQRTIGH